MPNRELREGLLTSDQINTLTAEEERLWTRLLLCCDDFGRFDGRPIVVKARAFPLADEMDGVSLGAVTVWLESLHAKRVIRLYVVDAKPFLVIQRWRCRVRANGSKYPDPPDDDDLLASDRHTPALARPPPANDGHMSDIRGQMPAYNEERGTRSEGRARRRASTAAVPAGSARPAETARKAPIPADFEVSEAVREWAAAHGFDRLDEHLESFRNKAMANGYRYANWDRAFMEAIRKDWAGLRVYGRGSQGRRGDDDDVNPLDRLPRMGG